MSYIISIQLKKDSTYESLEEIINFLQGLKGIQSVLITGNNLKHSDDMTRLLVTEFVCDEARSN